MLLNLSVILLMGVGGGVVRGGEGMCMAGGVRDRGTCVVWGRAWEERWPLQRMVRILLECILVYVVHCIWQINEPRNEMTEWLI